MKLFRHGAAGFEKPGVIWNGQHADVSNFGEDYGENFFGSGGIDRLHKWLSSGNGNNLPVVRDGTRFAAPFQRPSKIICIGLNFSDHAIEAGMPIPTEPVIFLKSTSALSGPNDPLIIPPKSEKTDWEVELAVVIGRKASHVTESKSLDFVAGYCVHNDYSEREFQLERGGQWVKGKSCDSFAPLGPYIVTKDEISDVNNLRMWLKVNGQIMQNSNSSQMAFKIPLIVSYVSQFMTLFPGDVISTGTPAGVGLGRKPPLFLKKGDIIELEIEELGKQRQEAI